jgi:hypothetical protein
MVADRARVDERQVERRAGPARFLLKRVGQRQARDAAADDHDTRAVHTVLLKTGFAAVVRARIGRTPCRRCG